MKKTMKKRKRFAGMAGKSWSVFLILSVLMFLPGVMHAENMVNMGSLEEKLTQSISLDLRNMNVVDVYKFLAIKGDFNISISKNIQGRITLYLNDVSIKDSLDIITIANNFGYKVIGDNIVHIMTDSEYMGMYGEKFGDMREVKTVYLQYAKPAYVLEALKNIKSSIGKVVIDGDTGSVVMIDTPENIRKMESAIHSIDHPLELRIFSLRYADAQEVARKLRKELDNKSVGSIEPDVRSNQVLVKAFPGRLEEIGRMIQALDVKTKAVLIDVQILKVKLNPEYHAGIDWETLFKESRYVDIQSYFPISTSATNYMSIGWGNFDVNDMSIELRLMQGITETKVLANPTIMVTNNEEARIHIGDKLAYVTTTTIGAGDSQRTNEEIHYIDVGVQFKVTPSINDDGYITMDIIPEISSQSGTLTTPQGAEIPLINSTLVETSIIVKDANTIVIGGLMEDSITKSKNGLPFLMDIPIIGKAFQNESNNDTQTEIVILLTPHIMGGDENYADTQQKRSNYIMPDKEY
jgi:type II secretory pathway component GspD/PulD (secretin)